ncbi:MAG: hypothetical protein DMG64_04730 [Acidobacteria bacterium]|nr:MAG: hypothetical protein DMG64_04730 [Acidobacteriota bacterium]PYY23586.1 MAG: hypothetical protein DMG62_07935 [Acidobacteriota bacterium]
MIRCRLRSLLVLAAAISLSCILAAAIPAELPTNVYQPASPNTNYDPGVIPNSAVAESDNCAKLADLEEQFEHGFSSKDLQRIQGPEQGPPLGVSGKFRLAVANVSDPFAIITTALDSEFGDAIQGHTKLRTGAAGFGQRFGASMAGQATSELMSTFLISSIFHQDPHYHRDPGAPTHTRIEKALAYVFVTRSDSGKRMLNFAEVLGTTSSSLLEGSYHPEWEKGPGAAAGRIAISIGSDAAWNLMTEFLPDVARHLNPRWMLLRRLADRASQQN